MLDKKHQRSAWTRIDLAVSLFCAVVAAGIAGPAIVKSKEAENRMRCQANLRQIGAALHQYHEAHGVFPPALVNSGGSQIGRATASFYADQPFRVYNHTGFTLLLPFIGQETLYTKYDFTYPSCNAAGYADSVPAEAKMGLADLGNGPDGKGVPGINPGNVEVVGSRVPTFECPTDHSPPLVDTEEAANFKGAFNALTNARRGNYIFNCLGSSEYTPSYGVANLPRGVFGVNGAAMLGELGDGLATTILAGECRQDLCTRYYMPHWGAGALSSVMGMADAEHRHINFPAGTSELPLLAEDCLHDEKHKPLQYHGGFGSWHLGGANFVFADGSVHFLPDAMDFALFQKLNAINDAIADSAE